MNIDEALRAYVNRPVPSGLEERILARCRRGVWWRWPLLGLAVAWGLSCLLWVRMPLDRARPVAAVRQYASPVVEESLPHNADRVFIAVHRDRAEALPRYSRRKRRDAIQALWRFAQQHPEQALQLTGFREPEPFVPLSIEPITIEELGDPK